MGVSSLGYVVAESGDVGAWHPFATAILGMMQATLPPGAAQGAAAFRIDSRPFRLLIEPGAREGFLTAGLEFASREDFQAALGKLTEAGIPYELAPPAFAKSRYTHELARCTDPAGNRLELYWGHFQDSVPFASPAGVSGFLTGTMGLGHVVFPTTQLEASRSFFVDLLGFGDADQTRVFLSPDPADPGLGLYFLHAQNPRHHTVALAEFPQPSGLIHLMLETLSYDDVGRAYDRAQAAGCHISATLGRHTNDKMFSFYVRSPGGFDIEYGTDGMQLDWNTFVPTTSLKDSDWGHKWNFG